jgi:hypothetical protein
MVAVVVALRCAIDVGRVGALSRRVRATHGNTRDTVTLLTMRRAERRRRGREGVDGPKGRAHVRWDVLNAPG